MNHQDSCEVRPRGAVKKNTSRDAGCFFVLHCCYNKQVKNISDYLDFFKNKDGKWTIIQFPNLLLIAWLLLTLVAIFLGAGSLKSSIQLLSSAVLFAWAYAEVTTGDSNFRRLLGGIILLYVVFSFFT